MKKASASKRCHLERKFFWVILKCVFTIIVLFTRYLCSVWAIKKLNRTSRFQKPNYIKILAEKVAKIDRRARNRYISLYGIFVKICVAKRSVRNENERAVNVWVRASQLAGFHYLASRSWVIFTRTTLKNFSSNSLRKCAEKKS
jgi:hypothetical protein